MANYFDRQFIFDDDLSLDGRYGKNNLRRGKWTTEEEAYANRLIQEFKAGLLPLTDGTTLRTFLSKLLNCDPMRISKKFVGQNCIGKQVFRRRQSELDKLTSEDLAKNRQIMGDLEIKFLERLAQTNRCKSGSKDGKYYGDDFSNGPPVPWMIPPDPNSNVTNDITLQSSLSQSQIISNTINYSDNYINKRINTSDNNYPQKVLISSIDNSNNINNNNVTNANNNIENYHLNQHIYQTTLNSNIQYSLPYENIVNTNENMIGNIITNDNSLPFQSNYLSANDQNGNNHIVIGNGNTSNSNGNGNISNNNIMNNNNSNIQTIDNNHIYEKTNSENLSLKDPVEETAVKRNLSIENFWMLVQLGDLPSPDEVVLVKGLWDEDAAANNNNNNNNNNTTVYRNNNKRKANYI